MKLTISAGFIKLLKKDEEEYFRHTSKNPIEKHDFREGNRQGLSHYLPDS